MGKIGEYTYYIDANALDFNRRPTLSAITDLVLAAAGDDADRNGFGVRDLAPQNWTWVLSRFCMELERYPEAYDTLRVHTWVSEIGRMMTTRNFLVLNEKGERLGAAISNWAMLDMSSRRAVDLSANLNYTWAVVDQPSPIEMPRRLATPAAFASEMTHRVVYSDLDFNRHTNAIRYLELMVDMLPLEYHEGPHPRRLDVNFLHESRYGDLLTVGMCCDPLQFEVRGSEGQVICRASMDWKAKK